MRYLTTYENFENFGRTFYSSFKEPILFKDFVETEVYGNTTFTQEDIIKWMDKYHISLDDKVIWVSPDRSMSFKFAEGNDTDPENKEYTLSDGFIISETNDSHNGFLMVLRDSLSQN